MKRLHEEDSIFDVDFDEFDKVVAREIIASKKEEEDEEFLMGADTEYSDELDADDFEDGILVSVDDLEDEGFEEIESTEEVEECSGKPETIKEEEQIELETADGPIEEKCGAIEEKCEQVEECNSKPVKEHKSILSIYESRKSKKKNKLVESLLVDSTVDSIEQTLKDILRSHGISNAEAVTTIGLILDRMLHADDDEVAAPEFLPDTIGEIVDNEDIHDVVVKAVEDALENPDNPEAPATVDCELNAVIVSSEDEEIPEVVENNQSVE